MPKKGEVVKKIEMNNKITASKRLKCSKCNSELYGENGYLEVMIFQYSYFSSTRYLRICDDCIKNLIGGYYEFQTNKEERKKIFDKLMRKQMIKKLR